MLIKPFEILRRLVARWTGEDDDRPPPRVFIMEPPCPYPRAAAHADPKLFARKYDLIVCNGPDEHVQGEFTRDVYRGEMQSRDAMRFYGINPKWGGDPSQECLCRFCGERWYFDGHYRFKGGWR